MRSLLITAFLPALLVSVLFAGCESASSQSEYVWRRIDGRSAKNDPALQAQFQADVAICEAAADHEGREAEAEEDLAVGQSTEPPSPGSVPFMTNNPARSSVLGSVASADAAEIAMKGCMARRGYLLAQ
jgi:hypothetical protein